jgi:uncharacterized protein with ParB-like and HNH nuclease domain
MSVKLTNKIEAKDSSINTLLKDQKFTIDYFQREYRWQEKHIKLLIEDLTNTFLKSYMEGDKRSDVANYQNYYLGPVVLSVSDGKKSIIDGQQRITSITLLLIYLNNLQKESTSKVAISELIFSEKFGLKSFNMTNEMREPCLKALFEQGDYIVTEDDDETVQNMVERFGNIEEVFPEEITLEILPYFIDWLIENVVIVVITAYSDENAYTIFETMNDRGLNLSPTEMLKGFVLSKISDKTKRSELNDLWKKEIKKLHEYDKDADLSFFQAWFRGKYAVTIRSGKAGSVDQDFELIGSRFHSWFKDNHKPYFNLNTSDEFYTFFKTQFPFYVKLYTKIWDAQAKYNANFPHLHYITHWGIADSLQNPLLFSSIRSNDDEQTIQKKIEYVSRYIETFTVRRAINFRKFGQTSIKYTMFTLAKSIRNNDLNTLARQLTQAIQDLADGWESVLNFNLHGMNRNFIKHLLSRISSYIDNLAGKDSTYVNYHHPKGKPFEIEHLWANKFEEHRDEFEQEGDFQQWRNSIGSLILLPQGTNQSFNSDVYEDKLQHYIRENTYAQTLHPNFYNRNPNFLNSEKVRALEFSAHPHFKKADIEKRQQLVKRICEQLWNVDFYDIS